MRLSIPISLFLPIFFFKPKKPIHFLFHPLRLKPVEKTSLIMLKFKKKGKGKVMRKLI